MSTRQDIDLTEVENLRSGDRVLWRARLRERFITYTVTRMEWISVQQSEYRLTLVPSGDAGDTVEISRYASDFIWKVNA